MDSFDTHGPITAVIHIVGGDVDITAEERATTTVAVVPADAGNEEDRRAAEGTRVEYAGGRLLVKTPKLRSWLPGSRGGSVDVTIALPAGSRIHGDGALADFHVEGPAGDCRIRTGMGRIRLGRVAALSLKSGIGDIDIDRVGGHAEVTTGSGEVRVGELAASGVIKNSNGDTWVGVAAGDLRVHAANGDITVGRSEASVGAKSANGDVRLNDVARGSVVLETSLGDLDVGIREGTAAWLDVRASAGRVRNELAAADAPEPTAETVEVRARTSAGDVVIRRPRP